MSDPGATTPVSALELYQSAAATFDRVVRQVGGQQWQAATPCAAWDVRELTNHIVGEARWMPPLLAGRSIADVGDELDGDLLGDDPLAAWQRANAEATSAAAAADPSAIVALSFGPTPVGEYLYQVAADHLIHAWDLAVAVGADTRLDAGLVAATTAWFVDLEPAYRGAGAIGPRPDLDPGASAQQQLLAMFGRHDTVVDALATVERFGAAFDAQDVDAVMACMTDDCVFESTSPPDGARHEGQAAVRLAWTQFFAESRGAAFHTESQFSCGDRVVAQWRYDWTGEQPGHIRGVDIFRVRDGLVAEKLSYVKG